MSIVSNETVSFDLKTSRPRPVSSLNLISNHSEPRRALPAMLIGTTISPELFLSNGPSASIPSNEVEPSSPDVFYFPEKTTSTTDETSPLTQNKIEGDLINFNANNEASILDVFDPFKKHSPPKILLSALEQSVTTAGDVVPSNFETSITLPVATVSPSQQCPIKLKLKLAACVEIKQFSEFVERLRNEQRSNQVNDK